ncbi:hypothetical protein CIPAW_10G141400 [Carya illinoinensis]|uniref:Uncharacterized protein n=1 Tax=Carya illinoinensis TaxID=32201 RepID=A0A8T1PEB6_CARIL|nr:hypothetical protein CIPAW_10G141400 [Carya illinoinensis]
MVLYKVEQGFIKCKSSDHCPMLIRYEKDVNNYGLSPFLFQSMWCTHENFMKCVDEVWREEVNGAGLFRLAAKLKKLKMVLRRWNKEVFCQLAKLIKALDECMEVLEFQLQESFLPDLEHEYLRTKAKLKLWENREELRLAQQAKKKGLKEGDCNTKFYHAIANQRRKASVISKMTLPNGVILDSLKMIHNVAVEYFKEFLTGEGLTVTPDLSGLLSPLVNDDENHDLVLLFKSLFGRPYLLFLIRAIPDLMVLVLISIYSAGRLLKKM